MLKCPFKRWPYKSKYLEDVYLNKKKSKFLKNRKIKTKAHGTGCTLSSAITTFLSCGKPLKKSCELELNILASYKI